MKPNEEIITKRMVCLCCNLIDLFDKYSYQPYLVVAKDKTTDETVIDPKAVRKALERFYSLNE